MTADEIGHRRRKFLSHINDQEAGPVALDQHRVRFSACSAKA
jgi:hypothetical protein